MHRRQPVQQAERGPEELVQAGERDVRLELDAPGGEQAHGGGLGRRVFEQRRLPHARLSPDDEPGAPPLPRGSQGLVDR